MSGIPGYAIKEELYRGRSTVVYRAVRLKDKAPVVVKTLAGDYPSSGSIARLKHDYSISRRLAMRGVVQSHELVNGSRGPVLVLEDFGGVTLRELLRSWRPDLREAIAFGEELAQILNGIHIRGVVHKDIKPENIIVEPLNRRPALTDFGISMVMSLERLSETGGRTEGTFAYMPPEQTGRINQSVDLRSDLYSAGVCLYELLTGELPFRGEEPAELIHSHIAVRAPLPGSIRKDLPAVVDAIVAKLLAKNPEDRYQSAHGLLEDLRRCRQALERGEAIADFSVGEQDRSVVPRFPRLLYGRARERDQLAGAFEEACSGGHLISLVSGPPGIGKSALIEGLEQIVGERSGYFVQGKFEQLKNARPYSAWLQAFRQLIKQIAAESEAEVAAWKERILSQPGFNVGVVAALVPELKYIVGTHPVPVDLAPADLQNRFVLAFRQFVACIAQRKHPLCIFLDDLQWADPESLRLLSVLGSDPDIQSSLVIGAFRTNEEETPALQSAFQAMAARGARIQSMELQSLGEADLQRMLADTLAVPLERSARLARQIADKTGGNPFYAREFISSMFQAEVLHYSASSGWSWDEQALQSMVSTENVVELMSDRLQHLAADTRHLLELAACIGSYFELGLLARVSGLSESQVAELLWEALVGGLVLFVTGESSAAYRFAHDRIQQAAYALLSRADRDQVHLRIGRALLQASEQSADAQVDIFATVNHFNRVRPELLNDTEHERLARLNLQAGEKARAASAFESAILYSNRGVEYLPANAWDSHYELRFALGYQRYECEQLTADREQLLRSFAELLPRARSDLERARIYNIKSVYYILQAEYREAVEAGLHALRFCGIVLPERPGQLQVLGALALVKWRAYRVGLRNIPALPAMSSEQLRMAIELFGNLGGPLFQYSPNLYAIAIIKMFQLTLLYGHTPITPMSLNLFAVIEGGVLGNLRGARYLSLLSLRLNRQFPDESVKSRARYMQAIFFSGWFEHTSDCLRHLKIAYDSALSAGDFYALGYIQDNPAYLMIMNGSPLEEIQQRAEESLDFVRRIDYREGPDFILPCCQFVRALRGETLGRGELGDSDYSEAEHTAAMRANSNALPLSFYYFIKINILYLFGRHADVCRTARASAQVIEISTCLVYITIHYFYEALSAASLHHTETSAWQRHKLRATLRRNHRKFCGWSRLNPKNFRHHELLLRAERLRCARRGLAQEIARLYDQAIEAARENRFIHLEAIANERAAEYYAQQGLVRIALPYFLRARFLFARWGASEKVRQLEEYFRSYGVEWQVQDETMGSAPAEMKLTYSATAVSRFRRLDIATVVRAAEAIAGALRLEDLFDRLLRLAIEHGGASWGALVLEREGQAMVEAAASVRSGSPDQNGSIKIHIERVPVEESEIPARILNFTMRTGEPLLLADALSDPAFSADEHIRDRQVRSVLCVPVLYQTNRRMILYMENDLSPGVFSRKRLELLRVLGNLAGVALENALVHDTLETRVQERTRELTAALVKEEELSEQLSLALERAEEAAEVRKRFTALVSHEYRNPLTSIKSAAFMLGKYGRRMTEHEQYEKLAAIEEEADHMESLLEDVLTLGRDPELRLVQTDLIGFCNDMLRRLPGAERIVFEHAELESPLFILLDRHLSHQILSNLLTNALKYSTAEVRLGLQLDGADVELSVADRGIGIPAAEVPRLFDAFFRASNTREVGGHGLGLSIVQRAVELQGGTISAQSVPGQGSRFLVRLPTRMAGSSS